MTVLMERCLLTAFLLIERELPKEEVAKYIALAPSSGLYDYTSCNTDSPRSEHVPFHGRQQRTRMLARLQLVGHDSTMPYAMTQPNLALELGTTRAC